MIDNDWRAQGNCVRAGIDPDHMQPEVATPDQVEDAKAICGRCPVLGRCRSLALSYPAGAYGVHAGEWYGEPPANPEAVQCAWCGEDMERGERGTRAYCGSACRKRAQRAREHTAA